MSKKAELIAKQKTYIGNIIAKYGVVPTDIARKIGVNSTTITRFYNGDPKHVLSSGTFDSIVENYPLDDTATEKSQLTQYEIALAYSLKLILKQLITQKMLNAGEMAGAFSDGVAMFQLRQKYEAVTLLEHLHSFVANGTVQTPQQELHTLLSLVPRGSA